MAVRDASGIEVRRRDRCAGTSSASKTFLFTILTAVNTFLTEVRIAAQACAQLRLELGVEFHRRNSRLRSPENATQVRNAVLENLEGRFGALALLVREIRRITSAEKQLSSLLVTQ